MTVLQAWQVAVILPSWVAMNSLELKVPPLMVTAIFCGLMWWARRLTPGLNFELPFRSTLGWSFGLAALAVCALASWELRKARTTFNPLEPGRTSQLVTSGIYRLSRNPIYLGFFLLLVGVGPASSNYAALLLAPLYGAYMTRFQIIPEERALRSSFGDEYSAYCERVRRWL